ncbi:MAG: DUF4905 domain-containing protein [Ignavibacteria bacterium]|nr:DUF4905 domain-containing protein [Ignavibacteria bacterium]
MKIKKHFTYKSKNQVWRLLVSDTSKLVIELRDVNKKEVFFSCYDLEKGKKIFEDFQLEERYWIGIETLYKDMIIFHKYDKPDMPGHKQIIGFDIAGKSIKWTESDHSFLFVHNDKIYCYKQNFESRIFYSLNYLTGILEEDLGEDFEKINYLRAEANSSYGEKFLFTEKWESEKSDPAFRDVITDAIQNLEIVGDVEYTSFSNLLLFSFHTKIFSGSLLNKFVAYDFSRKKIVLNEILNASTNAFIPDSFFLYKNYLLLLKEKNGLIVYKLE